MILRPYQTTLINETRIALRSHKSVLIQLATGGGKTAIATQMLRSVALKEKRGAFIVHRQELCHQTQRTFAKFNVPYGTISAGYTPFLQQPIQICSIDTLRARLRAGWRLPKFDFIIWDEAHHMAAKSWAAVKQYFPDALHVGLSATPERLDGKGLREHFSHMVSGPTIAELMDDGWLVRYKAYAPSTPDLSGVHTKMGDFVKSEVADAMQKSAITGDALTHYRRLASGKKFIARCVNIERSKDMAAKFRAAGYMSWHVDGDSNKGERYQAMEAFRRGDIIGMTNVNLLGEGVDVADATVFIDADPTKSLAKCMQGWGRVFRPLYADGYDLRERSARLDAIAASTKPYSVLLDHAGNMNLHGFPDDDRTWSLDGRQARTRKADDEAPMPLRQCPKCYAVHRPADRCPSCGWIYEAKAREVEQVDGSLQEIDVEAQRRERLAEQAQATTVDALIEVGRKRGYKSPEKWAAHLWTARLAKRKNPLLAINRRDDA